MKENNFTNLISNNAVVVLASVVNLTYILKTINGLDGECRLLSCVEVHSKVTTEE